MFSKAKSSLKQRTNLWKLLKNMQRRWKNWKTKTEDSTLNSDPTTKSQFQNWSQWISELKTKRKATKKLTPKLRCTWASVSSSAIWSPKSMRKWKRLSILSAMNTIGRSSECKTKTWKNRIKKWSTRPWLQKWENSCPKWWREWQKFAK